MKHRPCISLAIALVVSACAPDDKPELEEKKAKVNYSVGYQIGSDFKRQGVEINTDLLVRGITDAVAGEGTLMTAREMRATLMDLQRSVAGSTQRNEQRGGAGAGSEAAAK
jgi:FKBP-type peptidyl-prolyl cis-trans isomerase FklB